jgi:hypothetical protein
MTHENSSPAAPEPNVSLGEVAEIFLGVNLSRTRGVSARHRVPILQVKDVAEGLLSPRAALDQVDFCDDPRHARALLRPGDVIITARGIVSKCALVTEQNAGVLPTSNVIVIRPTATRLRPELILALLRHPRTKALLAREVAGVAVPTLRVASIARLRVHVPPLEEQRDLARLVELAEFQYETAMRASRLRRDLALAVVMQHLESTT